MSWAALTSSFLLYSLLPTANAVTVYGQQPVGLTSSAPGSTYTGLAAYDPLTLNAPPLPNPAPAAQYFIQLAPDAAQVPGLSIPQKASFLGFSIEVSVINQLLGKNSTFLQVPFLNLMATHVKRSGEVHVRVGGNTQDYATLVDSLDNGKIIEKQNADTINNPTATPPLLFTRDVFYLMGNISEFVNVKWYMGIPFNDTQDFRLVIAEEAERILGDKILGFQVGNEPDLYGRHGHRAETYSPFDYFGEFAQVINAINANPNIPVKNNLIGPSVASAEWTPEAVWDTGYIQAYASSLMMLSVEHYPTDNCYAQYGIGEPHDPQQTFPEFLSHTAAQNLVNPYLNSTFLAQQAGKPFVMFETNTASCGGFQGISDSFGASLWALDYGLQMAAGNFSEALFHVGGQNVYYNPFTSPPTGQSQFHEWTIGSIFYATLVVAEAFGPSGTARIIDLAANGGDVNTPAYAIYENDHVSKLAIFNYMTDPSGASDSYVMFAVGGGTSGQTAGTPPTVKVKYLLAPSVGEKTNITWAGQGFGGKYASDGRLKGDESITTVQCNPDNTCQVRVPAPGFALVFLHADDQNYLTGNETAVTYSTTAFTQAYNTIKADPSVVANSNGHNGKDRAQLGSTSYGSKDAASSLVPVTIFAGFVVGLNVLLVALA